MPSGMECQCCLEIHLVDSKVERAEIGCICDHPTFIANCLSTAVLEVSIIDYAQTEGPLDDNIPPHKYVTTILSNEKFYVYFGHIF